MSTGIFIFFLYESKTLLKQLNLHIIMPEESIRIIQILVNDE